MYNCFIDYTRYLTAVTNVVSKPRPSQFPKTNFAGEMVVTSTKLLFPNKLHASQNFRKVYRYTHIFFQMNN